MLGYTQRKIEDTELCKYIETLTAIDKNITRNRDECRDAAQIANRALQQYNKIKFDQRHKRPSKYKEGDLILIRVLQSKPGVNRKLAPKYKGRIRFIKCCEKIGMW